MLFAEIETFWMGKSGGVLYLEGASFLLINSPSHTIMIRI